MLTEYNSKRSILSTIRKKLTITLFAVLLAVAGFAQPSPVMVNVMVAPPYTSSISDYMNIPNKIVITLTHAALGYPEIDLYLKVSIIGDNGVSAISEPDFKPAYPINLQPGTSHTVNIDNISEAFNLKHIVIQGTTINELVSGAGLPEGLYQICVRAFNFKTGEPLSGEEPMGCSSMFPVTNLEPPFFINPICGAPQKSGFFQSVNVSWSIPAGTPVGTTYHFEMVEIPENVQIDPNEAFLTSKYPVLYEETTTQTMLNLTTDKISLNNDYTYVMKVTAEDPSGITRFRNNGTSEICWFKYEKQELKFVFPENDSINLVFLNPQQNSDTIEVNNENNLMMSWCWIKADDTGKEFVDQDVIAKRGLQKYVLTIEKTGSGSSDFSISKEFDKIDSTGLIKNNLDLTKEEALNAGFEDGATYIATLSAYNGSKQKVKEVESPKFVFKLINDEVPTVKIPVQAVINYGFKNYPDIFPVTNSEVIIEALVPQNSETDSEKSLGNLSKKMNHPSELINGEDYEKIASVVALTSTLGQLDTIIAVPEQYFENDSVAFRIRLANKYYVDKDFKPLYLKLDLQDSLKNPIVNFGTLQAKTYAYSLKLNVRKEFALYKIVKNESGVTVSLVKDGTSATLNGSSNETSDENQQYTYEVDKDTIAEGIPVVLYRVNKPDYIPVYEGDLTQSNPPVKSSLTNITVIAMGTTQREKDSTYVTFNKLLATNKPVTNGESTNSISTNEEYRILAIANLDSLMGISNLQKQVTVKKATNTNKSVPSTTSFGTLTPELNELITNAIINLEDNSSLTNFIDSGKFVAEPIFYSLKLPENTNSDDAYYRTVKANYTITSCTPPTSHIEGRLLYEWASDSNAVKRPLPNTHFRVIVDYVDGKGISIGALNNTSSGQMASIMGGHWETNGFQPDNSTGFIPLVDQYATMAEGVTDNDGNFSIEVININDKGNLGAGNVTHNEGSSKPPVEGQTPKDKLKEMLGGDDVININPYESVMDKFGASMYSIGSQQTQQVVGSQNSLNFGNFSVGFDAGTQSFELGKANVAAKSFGMSNQVGNKIKGYAHGPSPWEPEIPSNESEVTTKHYENFRRTFRIVIDGNSAPYYYPSKDVIEIDPFEGTASPITITHYVKEFKLKVKTYEKNKSNQPVAVTEVQATVFRGGKKPKQLPLGEGDGKYTYAALLSPTYNNSPTINLEYEQLWPNQMVNSEGMTGSLPGLLMSEYKNYYVQASSYVNTGSKAYNSNINSINAIPDTIIDWVNPTPPEVELPVLMTPMVSRALVLVRDSSSGQPLTSSRNTRVTLSKSTFFLPLFSFFNSVPVDNYGYVELLADQKPLSNYNINDTNPTKIFISASSDGFKSPEKPFETSFVSKGYQATPILALYPAAVLKGKIIDADYDSSSGNAKTNGVNGITPGFVPTNGVAAYIQADSSSIAETKNKYGYFEMPIAPKAGVKVKIIPKDVAWFDTTYVLTANDEKKQTIDLGTVKLYRRKHRIQFNIIQKMPSGFVGPATPVSGATIQLGEEIQTTASNGTAKFLFENVSVYNYTFIVKGPQGEGYIPKTVNLKSFESHDFKQVNVVLEKGSEITGTVKLDGKPVKNARVYIEVSNTATPTVNSNLIINPDNVQTIGQSPSGTTTPSATFKKTQGSGQNIQLSNQKNSIEGQNLKPNATLNSALAFKPTGSITNDANLVETRTDAQGKYKLQGIPVDNQKINIIATLDTTFTVSGDKQQASIINGQAQTDLNLTSFSNAIVNKLFGFPLTVEKITPAGNNQIKVTGLVHWTEAISDFTLKEDIKVLRVEDVLFDLVQNDNGPANAVAHDDVVTIPGITSLKLSYIGKYNVKLTSNGLFHYNSTPLQITKLEGYGKISGKMQIIDNSFNYPSSYLNFEGSEFFLARPTSDSTVSNQVSVATSAFSETESLTKAYQHIETYRKKVESVRLSHIQKPVPVYNLCNVAGGPISFKLINFSATANPSKSFIDETGKIHLNTQLKCHIDHAQPQDFSVSIPDMILDENKVYPASSNTPINVKLEEWDLEARDWTFSTTEGGILSTKALIRTKIIDIPVKKFVLRSDKFIMTDYEFDSISMGGGKFPLKITAPESAHLNYEYKVGSTMKPHWNFCLLGTAGTSVASLPALQGLPENYIIELNYIEILSNNEMIVQLKQDDSKPLLHGNNAAQFRPLSLFNGPDYIGVTGLLNTGAPRMGDILLTADWRYPTQNPSFENVNVDFEGKGFVHFEANKQKITIDPNQLTIEGRVLEKPDRTFNPIPSTFIADKIAFPKYKVELRKGWITQLSEKEPDSISQHMVSDIGYKLEINSGGMTVENGDWTTLTYEGTMRSNTDSENIKPTITKFEVLGDVNASSESLAVTGIDTPFGSMEQVFDFKTMEMRGSLSISKQITMGAITLNSGTIETLFGKSGFYVAGGCNAYLIAGLLTGTYNLGFMAGSYSKGTQGLERAWSVANSYISPSVINACYKSKVLDNNGLNGIYTTVNRQVIDASFGFDFILASGYVRALALLGGDFYANFSSTASMGADAFVFVDVAAGLSCITGTSISGGLYTKATFGTKLQLNPNKMTINGSMNMGFNGSISQSLVVGSISKSFNVGCSVNVTTNTDGETNFKFNDNSCNDAGVEKCN